MSHLNADDKRRVADVRAALSTIDLSKPHSSAWAEEFAQLLRLDQFMLYALAPEDRRLVLERFETLGWPTHAREAAVEFMSNVPADFAYFNPLKTPPWQRNRALSEDQLARKTGKPPPAAIQTIKRILSPNTEQLRVLVCDGPALIAWVGGFTEGGISARDVHVLNALAPSLNQRLVAERALGEASYRELLGAALENISAPAYVVNTKGVVAHCNVAALAVLRDKPRETKARLRELLANSRAGARLPGVTVTGVAGHQLIVDRSDPERTLDARIQALGDSLGLTRRQREVLALLARGAANSTIAAILGCATRTVEVHVSAILERAGAESRAEVIARIVAA